MLRLERIFGFSGADKPESYGPIVQPAGPATRESGPQSGKEVGGDDRPDTLKILAPSSSLVQDRWFSAIRHRFKSGWGYSASPPHFHAGASQQ